VPLESVANKTRTVPLDEPLIASALAVGTSFGVSDLAARLPNEDVPLA
jgi:6-phosphofructokinase 1